jgi:hypothetical protein
MKKSLRWIMLQAKLRVWMLIRFFVYPSLNKTGRQALDWQVYKALLPLAFIALNDIILAEYKKRPEEIGTMFGLQ